MKNLSLAGILYFLNKQKILFFWILLSALVVAFLEAFSIATLLPVFNLLIGGTPQTYSSRIFLLIVSIIERLPFNNKLIASLFFLLGITVLRCSLSLLNSYLISVFSGNVMFSLKKDLLQGLAQTPYESFLEQKQGDLLYQGLIAPEKTAMLLRRLPFLGVELLKIIFIVILLFSLNVFITLAMVLIGAIFLLLIRWAAKKISYSFGKERLQATTTQSIVFNEFINGIKQIMVYNAQQRWFKEFNKANKKLRSVHIKNYVWAVVPRQFMEVLVVITFLVVMIIVNNLQGGNLVGILPLMGVFTMALLRLFPSLGYFGRAGMEIAGLLPDLELSYEISQRPVKPEATKVKAIKGFNQSIVFDDVRFAYKNRPELLRGTNFVIEKGKLSAIVGISGSGKTTIINLILGLFQPRQGEIMVDGQKLHQLDLASWHNLIALVSQDTFIFHSTIKDNISFGCQCYSQQDIERAARMANASEFIDALPQRYDTLVGEKGMKLSGGQQQRIAIARAILRNPQIIILDEATSNLDNVSEKAVQQAINNIAQSYTIIVIAHRLSTVQNADKIIVLKDGVVAEEGFHQELITRNQYYSHLYKVLDA